jgi:hypothetical protein
MTDFRDRFGLQLANASAGFVTASESDFRVRLGIQLTRAAGELAAARRPLAAPSRREPALRLPRLGVPRLSRPLVPGMDFRARLGLQLTRAAGELAAARRPLAAPSRRERAARIPHVIFPRLSRPIAIGLTLTAFAGAATAGVLWLPQIGDSRFGENPPSISATAPPQNQLAALAVLRRPQTTADQNGALTTGALRAINSYTTGVRTNYIRVLAGSDSTGFVLVPVAQRLAGGASDAPSSPLSNALCLYAANSAGLDFVNCYSLRQVLAGTAGSVAFGNQMFGLAPDGVATVTVSFASGIKLSAPVQNNLYDLTLPASSTPLSTPTVTFSPGAS